jgi:hypothetical protein
MKKPIDVERIEKSSSIVRNLVLIIGAICTAFIFVSKQLNDELTVTNRILYFGGENTILASPILNSNLKSKEKPYLGRLGTLSQLFITNNTKLPVSLEVRIPNAGIEKNETTKQWDFFTTISVEPGCHLKKDEISISNNGLILPDKVGTVSINKFPPDCSIDITIASSQLDKARRFKCGDVEVFYDGKKAKIDYATTVYGKLGKYIDLIQERGILGVIIFLIVPILLIIFFVILLIEILFKSARKQDST